MTGVLEIHSHVVVTHPDGRATKNRVRIHYIPNLNAFEFQFMDESQVERYKFLIVQSELKRARDQGRPM